MTYVSRPYRGPAVQHRRHLTLMIAMASAAAILTSQATAATSFTVVNLDLGAGFALSGTIQTNGATGILNSADITNWNLKVVAVSDVHYTPANSINVSSNVTSVGGHLVVPTSSDGTSDGGSLAFRGGNDFAVQVADFTGANAHGGQAFYVAGGAFDFKALGQPNGFNYIAANQTDPLSSTFDLVPLHFLGGEVMSGSITTNGATGPAMITNWDVLVRDTQTWRFNPSNSSVLNLFGLMSDGKNLTVSPLDDQGNPGQFSIGSFNHFDFTGVLLGDYSFDPTGVAGLVTPSIFQTVSSLPVNGDGNFVVGIAVPEPGIWALMLVGFGGLGAVMRSRRRTVVAA